MRQASGRLDGLHLHLPGRHLFFLLAIALPELYSGRWRQVGRRHPPEQVVHGLRHVCRAEPGFNAGICMQLARQLGLACRLSSALGLKAMQTLSWGGMP